MTTTPRLQDVEDWWDWNYADTWDSQMEEHGCVVCWSGSVDPDADRTATLAELHWVTIRPERRHEYVPSRLWDASTPSTVGYRR